MNKQWVVVLTQKDGRVSIGGLETRVAEHHHIFNEQAAEDFASVCRDTLPNLYSAQVVNVEYCDPENIEAEV